MNARWLFYHYDDLLDIRVLIKMKRERRAISNKKNVLFFAYIGQLEFEK